MVTIVMDEQVVKNTIKIEQHDEDIKEVKAEIKELKEKTSLLTELSLTIKTLAENLKDVKETVTDIKKDQNSIKDEVAEIRQMPEQSKAKIFDKVVVGICAAIGGGLLTWILTNLFPTLFK